MPDKRATRSEKPYGGPLALPTIQKTAFHLHVSEVARLIADKGEEPGDVTVRVKNLAKRGCLHPAGIDKGDRRGALLFTADAALTARALFAALDVGVEKDRLMRLAGAMQVWTGTFPAEGDPRTPAAFVLMAHRRGDLGHSLELHQSRDPLGRLQWKGLIRDAVGRFLGKPGDACPDGNSPEAALVINLDVFARTVLARIDERKLH